MFLVIINVPHYAWGTLVQHSFVMVCGCWHFFFICFSSRRQQSEFPGSVSCQWLECNTVLNARYELSEHVRTCHVEPMTSHEVFVCLWRGCKVFNKPSLSHSWLSKHVNTHTGDKPFKCMISGCYLSFSSQEGLARHVPSHFKEPTQPKRNKSDDSPKKALKRNKIKLVQRRRPPVQGKFDSKTSKTK